MLLTFFFYTTSNECSSVGLYIFVYARVSSILFAKYATAKICITPETRVPQQFVHPTFGIRYPGFQYPGIRYPVSEFSASGYPVSGIRVSDIRYPDVYYL